ncbi:FKBP-type peptidyl-prolyl cis-trans isomerase SlyD [Desulfacinum hydrothermale DSM 13146]|uniref:Peptidyl-prolyl cis-trans isomerase n=1 Tax=Desulfacinum hydrothermale DSM 13146 TaxID=1121390 RepID=A0A1W1XB08_9BACT|nr:peptidylprolyl isomerase [Desulfacinum hydrothermale]SMC21126.1 FKBP-type peptidyl-prolyl cis-trans isomerase SlyD [Desulfacinum hydrothermale DSM 13146]
MEVIKDHFVVIEYSVRLDDGTVLKGGEEPASMNFAVGYDQVLPALESRLLGKEVGEELSFTIPAREAFGERDPQQIRRKSFDEFPQGRNLEVGKWVVATNDVLGAQYTYYVQEKDADGVVLDYNHPLAGKDLHYQVKIMSVRPLEPEEMAELRPCKTGDVTPPGALG